MGAGHARLDLATGSRAVDRAHQLPELLGNQAHTHLQAGAVQARPVDLDGQAVDVVEASHQRLGIVPLPSSDAVEGDQRRRASRGVRAAVTPSRRLRRRRLRPVPGRPRFARVPGQQSADPLVHDAAALDRRGAAQPLAHEAQPPHCSPGGPVGYPVVDPAGPAQAAQG